MPNYQSGIKRQEKDNIDWIFPTPGAAVPPGGVVQLVWKTPTSITSSSKGSFSICSAENGCTKSITPEIKIDKEKGTSSVNLAVPDNFSTNSQGVYFKMTSQDGKTSYNTPTFNLDSSSSTPNSPDARQAQAQAPVQAPLMAQPAAQIAASPAVSPGAASAVQPVASQVVAASPAASDAVTTPASETVVSPAVQAGTSTPLAVSSPVASDSPTWNSQEWTPSPSAAAASPSPPLFSNFGPSPAPASLNTTTTLEPQNPNNTSGLAIAAIVIPLILSSICLVLALSYYLRKRSLPPQTSRSGDLESRYDPSRKGSRDSGFTLPAYPGMPSGGVVITERKEEHFLPYSQQILPNGGIVYPLPTAVSVTHSQSQSQSQMPGTLRNPSIDRIIQDSTIDGYTDLQTRTMAPLPPLPTTSAVLFDSNLDDEEQDEYDDDDEINEIDQVEGMTQPEEVPSRQYARSNAAGSVGRALSPDEYGYLAGEIDRPSTAAAGCIHHSTISKGSSSSSSGSRRPSSDRCGNTENKVGKGEHWNCQDCGSLKLLRSSHSSSDHSRSVDPWSLSRRSSAGIGGVPSDHTACGCTPSARIGSARHSRYYQDYDTLQSPLDEYSSYHHHHLNNSNNSNSFSSSSSGSTRSLLKRQNGIYSRRSSLDSYTTPPSLIPSRGLPREHPKRKQTSAYEPYEPSPLSRSPTFGGDCSDHLTVETGTDMDVNTPRTSPGLGGCSSGLGRVGCYGNGNGSGGDSRGGSILGNNSRVTAEPIAMDYHHSHSHSHSHSRSQDSQGQGKPHSSSSGSSNSQSNASRWLHQVNGPPSSSHHSASASAESHHSSSGSSSSQGRTLCGHQCNNNGGRPLPQPAIRSSTASTFNADLPSPWAPLRPKKNVGGAMQGQDERVMWQRIPPYLTGGLERGDSITSISSYGGGGEMWARMSY